MKRRNLIIIPLIILSFFIHTQEKKDTNMEENGLFAQIETSKGNILIKLEYTVAPHTVANFVTLANGTNPNVAPLYKNKLFYDGLIFHRVLSDFMIQGGDPKGTGIGGPGYSFKDEFTKNDDGELILKHNRSGVLSMANSGPHSNGSQFFITHVETPWLDDKHTVFGYVVDTESQNVVNAIQQNDTITKVKIIPKGEKAKKWNPLLFLPK